MLSADATLEHALQKRESISACTAALPSMLLHRFDELVHTHNAMDKIILSAQVTRQE